MSGDRGRRVEKELNWIVLYIHKFIGSIISIAIVVIIMLIIEDGSFYSEKIVINESNVIKEDGRETIIKCKIDTEGKVVQPIMNLDIPKSGIVVYIDGEKIHDNNNKDSVYSYGNELVELPEEYAGKELELHIFPKEEGVNTVLPELYIFNEMDYSQIFTKKEFLRVAAALVILTCGIAFALSIVFLKLDDFNETLIKWMSLFCITGSVWTFVSSGALVFANVSFKVMYVIEYMALYVALYSLFSYWVCEIELNSKQKRITDIMKIIFIVYYVVAISLHMLGITTVYSILVLIQSYGIICAVYMCIIGIRVSLRKGISNRKMIVSFIIIILLFLICLHEIIRANMQGFSFKNSMLPYFVLCFAFVSIVRFINRAIKGYVDEYKVESLKKLAYTDVMLGINNRNSCEKYFKSIMKDAENKYYMLMFDINGLKKINDTMGHQAGDSLIKGFSKLLVKAFDNNNNFIGRMGGDEFIVIMQGDDDYISNGLIRLDEYVKKENLQGNNGFSMSYSYGKASCDRSKDENVWKKYSEADEKMYDMKRE